MGWEEQAEQEYIRGRETYRALAQKYGVSEKELRRMGRSGGWHQARLAYRKEERAEPAETLQRAAAHLCRSAGRLARELDDPAAPLGKGDLKALHEAVSLLKDLAALLQNLKGSEPVQHVEIRMGGEIDELSH